MKNVILSGLAMAFLFVACNANTDSTKEATPNETITTDTTVKTENRSPVVAGQQYACSMHPEVTGKKGERCHKCNMELTEPVKNKEIPE
ncbi:MAG: heavy metal-binding domain-containing protein [Chitinophagaceae bacterium]